MLQHDLNHKKSPTSPERINNIKKCIKNFHQEGIIFPPGQNY